MMGRNPKERATVLNVVALLNSANELYVPMIMEKYRVIEKLKAAGMSHRALVYDNKAKEDAWKDVARRLASLKGVLGENKFFTGQYSLADAATLITSEDG